MRRGWTIRGRPRGRYLYNGSTVVVELKQLVSEYRYSVVVYEVPRHSFLFALQHNVVTIFTKARRSMSCPDLSIKAEYIRLRSDDTDNQGAPLCLESNQPIGALSLPMDWHHCPKLLYTIFKAVISASDNAPSRANEPINWTRRLG